MERIRVGVVGLGLIAQVVHLESIRLLADRYEVAALCDLSERALAYGRERFPKARTTKDWRELLEVDLDAVMVLTPGSHAPIAVAAAERGLDVFVEKPMCFSVEEGREMVERSAAADAVLMVGYMKRFDPAYERLVEECAGWDSPPRLVRVTTLEAPWEPYTAHLPRARAGDVDPGVVSALLRDDERRISAAIGTDDECVRHAYRAWLLDSMVHELNAVRGLLGEPTELRFADIWGGPAGVTLTCSFGAETECVFMWADLPGLTRYELEIGVFSVERRAALSFPSPYLRNAPTRLVIEGGEPHEVGTWRTEHTVSYESAFERELVEFHAAVTERRAPRTPGFDGLRDVALCQAAIRSYLEGRPVADPTAVAVPGDSA